MQRLHWGLLPPRVFLKKKGQPPIIDMRTLRELVHYTARWSQFGRVTLADILMNNVDPDQ